MALLVLNSSKKKNCQKRSIFRFVRNCKKYSMKRVHWRIEIVNLFFNKLGHGSYESSSKRFWVLSIDKKDTYVKQNMDLKTKKKKENFGEFYWIMYYPIVSINIHTREKIKILNFFSVQFQKILEQHRTKKKIHKILTSEWRGWLSFPVVFIEFILLFFNSCSIFIFSRGNL